MLFGACFGFLSGKTQEAPADPQKLLARPSFLKRDSEFKKTRKGPTEPRHRGVCKVRDGWGGWVLAYLVIDGKQLLWYHHDGSPVAPGPDEKPHKLLSLTGATVAASRKEEIVLGVLRSSQLTITAGSEQEREEWMAGLALVPGVYRRVSDYYVLGRAWGHGATCEVRECWHKHTGQHLAIKTRLHRNCESTAHMHNELRVLQLCARHPHPTIPQLHDFFYDIDGSIEIVTDLMEGGELFDYIQAQRRFDEEEACEIFRTIVEGVAHLHSLGIAHRDLKPENLMFTSAKEDGGQLKIMDFDLAKANHEPEWHESLTTPQAGTTYYMAPEVIHRDYSDAVDMWSLGVILYVMFTGELPFKGRDEDETEVMIEAGDYPTHQSVWQRISPDAKDLLRRLLQVDPNVRITAQQALEHPWLAALSPAEAEAAAAAAAEG